MKAKIAVVSAHTCGCKYASTGVHFHVLVATDVIFNNSGLRRHIGKHTTVLGTSVRKCTQLGWTIANMVQPSDKRMFIGCTDHRLLGLIRLRVYLLRYAGSDPFEMCVCDYAQQARAMGIKLKSYDNPFPHHALHDAEEQGKQFAEFVKKWQLRKQTLQNLEHRISQQKDMIKSLERKIKHINALD